MSVTEYDHHDISSINISKIVSN